MQGYKPWQLCLGYIIGLGFLAALLIVAFFGRVIVFWAWDRVWEFIFLIIFFVRDIIHFVWNLIF